MSGYAPERTQSEGVLSNEKFSKPVDTKGWDILCFYMLNYDYFVFNFTNKGFSYFLCKYAGRRKRESLLYLCVV